MNGKVVQAKDKFNDVITRDPKFAPARRNLGYSNLVLSTFEPDEKKRIDLLKLAADDLDHATAILQTPETFMLLGDAYVYQKQFAAAMRTHQNALNILNASSKETADRSAEVTLVFFSEVPNTVTTTGPGISVTTLAELRMLTLYDLAFDEALLGKLKDAQKLFQSAVLLDPDGDYNAFIANKSYSLMRLTAPKSSFHWLENRINLLCRERRGCKPAAMSQK